MSEPIHIQNEHFTLIAGWLYVRNARIYREFFKLGCRVVFVGCQTCPKDCGHKI